jgi:glycosyltransferase involved in cell wall biosynthesis
MSQPLLSIYLCNYNHGRYLKQCLRGFQVQTFTDFEIVVTDDGSTDDSQDIIRDYAANDPRFRPNYFPKNRGVRAAFIDASGRTTGKYLFGAAADDFIVNKDFFQKAVTALEADPRPAGFYGMCGVFLDETQKITGGMGTALAVGYNTPLQCCEGFLKCRAIVTGPSTILRRDLFMEHGGADMGQLIDDLGPQMDFYLYHRLAFTHGMHYENTLFTCQRVYEANTSFSANANKQLWDMARRFAEMERRLRTVCPTYPDIEQDWFRWRAYWMMDTIRKSGIRI